ncbi:MAG: PilZ domain-containing protein [Polyangiaceae bacterium]|nr:PilZ domain-containing protein [Polyangiaceae bacterium]
MTEKRAHPRVPCTLEVRCVGHGIDVVCQSRDVSVGGMFLHAEGAPAFGVELRVRFTHKGQTLEVPAVVRWAAPDGFGVQFGLMGARETHALTELMRGT